MKKIFLLLLFLPLTLFSFSQLNKISLDSILKKWIPAVIDLEVRSFDKNTNKHIGYSGTAIFLEHNKKYYLITARHVLANRFDSNKLGDQIILIDNLSQKNNWANETFIPLINQGIDFQEFSNTKEDLALLRIKSVVFITTLKERGYKAITISDIDSIWKQKKNNKVVLIGYPEISWVSRKQVLDMQSDPIFGTPSNLVSIPLITQGLITDVFGGKYYFYANVSMNHGNSGGPLICNNKLIGIASKYDTISKEISSIDQLSKFYFCNNLFIKSSLIISLLRKLEKRISLVFPNIDF